MSTRVKRRTYDATARRAQSQQTRRRILDAARTLIIERGYHAATVAAIARAAGVNGDTVYELAGRKPVILRELIEEAISGLAWPVPAQHRDYVRAMQAEPNAARKLEIYARAVRRIHQRMAPLFIALREAAATEPEALAVWRDVSDRRAANMRLLVREVAAAGGLRSGLSVDVAADSVWLLAGADVYVLLTADRGWSRLRYEQWLADAMHQLLLPAH